MRLAVWSGPRNLSTAMMYAFGNRRDFAAWDEPFYAPYLQATGIDHPMADRIMASHETSPLAVAARCIGPVPGKKPHLYMKHMPHHMIDGFPMHWAESCHHVHLIRHPARVIASYSVKRENPTLEDLGFQQQTAIFDRFGGVVIDSHDIRANPERAIATLCAALGLPFDQDMLSWRAGSRAFDGVWADHWYGAVHHSTGFAGVEGPLQDLHGEAADLLAAALPHYEAMAARKLRIAT